MNVLDNNKIYFFKEVFTAEEIKAIELEEENSPWEFGATTELTPQQKLSSSSKLPRKFWMRHHNNNNSIKNIFSTKIKSLLELKEIQIDIMNTNGQAHGQSGEIHVDRRDKQLTNVFTMIYYKQHWQPIYGGFTLVFDNENNVNYYLPAYNTCIIFDSRLQHVGLEPTIHCPGQRETIAVKFTVLE
jgi:hypothetical protein